jgi:hypothetical protein
VTVSFVGGGVVSSKIDTVGDIQYNTNMNIVESGVKH